MTLVGWHQAIRDLQSFRADDPDTRLRVAVR